MNKIKDITLLAFVIIGFYTVISSFTTKPEINSVYYKGKTVEGNLTAILYYSGGKRLIFQTDNKGKFEEGVSIGN